VEGLFQVGCRRIPRPGQSSQKVEIEIESGMDSEAERSRERVVVGIAGIACIAVLKKV
jgi:hypothetical protein